MPDMLYLRKLRKEHIGPDTIKQMSPLMVGPLCASLGPWHAMDRVAARMFWVVPVRS